jgi:molybdopterin converting factor subunit 1
VESRNILSFYQSFIQNGVNMKYKINLFGITRDIVGGNVTEIELGQLTDVQAVLGKLKNDFPKLKEIKSLMIAVNSEYAEADLVLSENDEIALIPPVSGG